MRSVRAVAPVWPSIGRERDTDLPTTVVRRKPRVDRAQTWVLVASAFLLGVVLGAAAFVGVWRTTATRGDRADAARAAAARKLDHAQARSAALGSQLDRVRANLAAVLQDKKHLKVELRNAVQQAAAAGQQAAGDRTRLATIQHRASTVSSYVASLDAYVKATPSQSLDSSFLGSQLGYLSAATHRLQTP